MVDSKENFAVEGKELEGLYGTYKVCKRIGQSGNGIVYEAYRIRGKGVSEKEELAVKISNYNNRKKKEQKKRKKRFYKEIEAVTQLQGIVDGMIPIYDSSFRSKEKSEYEWYVMPYADKYEFTNNDVERKLEDLKLLGQTILQLHNAGYAHRDIKPGNILYYRGRISLSDFGLIWNKNEGSHITEVYDHLGPVDIRPPEMNHIGNIEEIDYQMSDVYLFAKTLWIILTGNDSGFQGEYSRSKAGIRLDRGKLNIKTLEPLHELLSQATKYYWEERIDMKKCLALLDKQLDVIYEKLPAEEIAELKYQEVMREINDAFIPDNKIYEDKVNILKIINELAGMNIAIVFEEFGKQYNPMELKSVDITPDELFELEVNSLGPGYTGMITIDINNMIMDKKLMCTITTKVIPENAQHDHTFTKLSEALTAHVEDNIYISGNYIIRMALPTEK